MAESNLARFTVGAGHRIHNTVMRDERRGETEPNMKRGTYNPAGDSGCDRQNTIWDITIFGAPTSGTWVARITVNNVTEDITFQFDETNVTFKNAISAHSEIADIDVTVTYGPLPNATLRVEFVESLARTLILAPTVAWASLNGGTGRGITVNMAQRGH